MTFTDSKFTCFVEEFTPSTYIMVIVSDKDIESEAINLNIRASRKYFDTLVTKSIGGGPSS